jgi:Iap family predicted aminopeptidase
MNNKEQTAVDWLINEIEAKGNAWENVSIRRLQISIDVSDYMDLKSKAKAMEKEQMIEFAQEVFRNRYNQITQSLGNIADEIYNENYGE